MSGPGKTGITRITETGQAICCGRLIRPNVRSASKRKNLMRAHVFRFILRPRPGTPAIRAFGQQRQPRKLARMSEDAVLSESEDATTPNEPRRRADIAHATSLL